MLMMLTALRFNKNETRLHKLSYWSTSETALLVLCGTFQHSISDISGVTKICPQKSIKDAKIMEGQCRKAWWVRDRDATELTMSVTQCQEVTEARTFVSVPMCRFGTVAP